MASTPKLGEQADVFGPSAEAAQKAREDGKAAAQKAHEAAVLALRAAFESLEGHVGDLPAVMRGTLMDTLQRLEHFAEGLL